MTVPLSDLDLNSDVFILHRYPYKESSLLLKCLSRTQGLLTVIAHGVRSKSAKRAGALGPFARYHMDLQGRGEIKTLKSYEWQESLSLHGIALYAGLYCNDLLLVFLPLGLDPEHLFFEYQKAVKALQKDLDPARAVRQFEYQLLAFLGVMPVLDQDSKGDLIQPDQLYRLERLSAPPERISDPCINPEMFYQGSQLLKIAAQDFETSEVCDAAKRLFQRALQEAAGRTGFRSREVLKRILGERGVK